MIDRMERYPAIAICSIKIRYDFELENHRWTSCSYDQRFYQNSLLSVYPPVAESSIHLDRWMRPKKALNLLGQEFCVADIEFPQLRKLR